MGPGRWDLASWLALSDKAVMGSQRRDLEVNAIISKYA